LLISIVIISATRVFGVVGMFVGIGMTLSSIAVFEKLIAQKKEILKIMYLRNLK
jgi:predicted PurR-regulated permease PerM